MVRDAGLTVALCDVLDIAGGALHPGHASAHYLVRFSVAIFRPFIGEIIVGTVVRCDKTGIFVSLGFFDDIFVPAALLHRPTKLYVCARVLYDDRGR